MSDTNVHPLFKPILDQIAPLEAQVADYQRSVETACQAMRDASKKIEDLRDALRMYGWHTEKCPARLSIDQLLKLGVTNHQECTCGFDTATGL